jgi:hypothetical protein
MKTKERLEFERSERLQQLINIRFGKKEMEIEPNPCWEGYEPIGLKEDGSPNCVPIKAKKEGFVIPTPDSGEVEEKYISRCMEAIGGEYDTPEQALAVCYAQLEK